MNIRLIGEVIRDSRTKKKLTQLQVAQGVGISRNYLSDVENGRYTPSLATLSKIITFLEIDLNFFNVQ